MVLFASWLDTQGYDRPTGVAIPPSQFVPILLAYLIWATHSRQGNGGAAVSSQTLRHYLTAASTFLFLLTGHPCDLSNPAQRHSAQASLHPALQDVLSQRATWSQPRPRYEPITMEILNAIGTLIPSSPDGFLTACSLVQDVATLAVFTGSRASEYCQSNLVKDQPFHVAPAAAGQWASSPLAFMASDFTFYSGDHRELPYFAIYDAYKHGIVQHLRVRFRFDKGPGNFKFRKFTRHSGSICPVRAAARLCHRAALLQLPVEGPLCAHLSTSARSHHRFTYLRDYTVRNTLQQACVVAYPDLVV
jgi:hypothetical protein